MNGRQIKMLLDITDDNKQLLSSVCLKSFSHELDELIITADDKGRSVVIEGCAIEDSKYKFLDVKYTNRDKVYDEIISWTKRLTVDGYTHVTTEKTRVYCRPEHIAELAYKIGGLYDITKEIFI